MARDHRARPTISDVATRAGVSRSTASRALTGNGYAAPDVKERVRNAAQELGYVPDANARGLKARISPTVGVLVSDLRNPFYAEVAAGAASHVRQHGYTIVLVGDATDPADELEAVRTFLALRVTGVLLTPGSDAATRFLLDQRMPVVEVDRQFCEGSCDAVLIDNVTAGRDLTDHLLALGHERIAVVVDELSWTTIAGRLEGYRQALAEAGRTYDPDLVLQCGFDQAVIADGVRRLLTGPNRPTAVFAANNQQAEIVWRQATALGLRIPGDLSLAAFDDAAWMSMVEPGITTVAQPAFELGGAAADVLLSNAVAHAAPGTTLLGSTLISRGSTGAPRGARSRSR